MTNRTKRGLLLDPPVVRSVQRYSVGLVAHRADGEEFVMARKMEIAYFRPQKLFANVKELGFAKMTHLQVNGVEQLFGKIDLYTCSIEHGVALDRPFLEEHGLTNLSAEQIDDWLDDHEATMPSDSVGRLDLPTMSKGMEIIVSGKFTEKVPADFILVISILGAGME